MHRLNYIISQDVQKNAEILRNFISRTKISVCACPQHFLYSFSNLTLGNPSASRMGFRNIQECLLVAKDSSAPKGAMASCVFANYLAMVLMHLPTDGLPPLQDFLPSLPSGLRAYAVYVLAHNAYLHKEYKRALGLCQSVFLMLDGCYPVAMEYLYCVIIMCLINLKQQDEAREALIKSMEHGKTGWISGTVYRISWVDAWTD